MNFVTIVFLASMLLPFCSGEEIGENIYLTNRVKRNSQGAGTPRDWQWYLKDTPVSMNVMSAWRAGYTGKGVLVAVVDNGVNMNHLDLYPNFNVDASYDFLKNRPISKSYSPGNHGTNCAGIVAGGNNSNCGVGIAFNAQIASLRLFDDNSESNDEADAKALSYKKEVIDIYSNSWGPGDMGWLVEGPGPRSTQALKNGAQLGRRGKGSIFVFAAGNGGLSGDSCAFSGFVNNIYTIAISGVNWDGGVPGYAEKCAAIMAVTYGQDILSSGNVKPPVITAEGNQECTEDFSGTSGTTAMASGIIALALEANPDLTWRDVQHLIARSSKPLNPPSFTSPGRHRQIPSWKTNAANLLVSHYYGFGLMDANTMVKYAKNWTSVPEQLSCEVHLNISNSDWPQIPWSGQLPLVLNVNKQSCGIRYLEHVQVQVDLIFSRRGYLEMSSVSPNGTSSRLLYPRTFDSLTGLKNFTNWTVTSLHYWGENPVGNWRIVIRNTKPWRKSRNVLDQSRSDYQAVGKSKGVKSAPTKAVNGGYSQWSNWSQCNPRCGSGTQQRSRSCTYPPHTNRGTPCIEPTQQTRICTSECPTPGIPINGGYSQWSHWSWCSMTCDGGTQHRSRSCTSPPPTNGGKDCIQLGKATESRRCYTQRCPVDGGYSNWSHWNACSKSCDGGFQRRYRSCTNPPPAYGGRNCRRLGGATESRSCNTHKCPGPLFSLKLILYGTKEDPLTNNRHVDRSSKKIEKVQIDQRKRDIPVHGGYSKWSYWRFCSKSCGEGIQQRVRYCTNPRPANRGRDCKELQGPDRETRRCNIQRCPVEGGYTPWSHWSSCSRSCARGTQDRHRLCTNPTPAYGGRDCRRLGRATESRSCNTNSCPSKEPVTRNDIDGGYSQWSLWSSCSVTCGVGTLRRIRSCNNPPPANGGASCRGPAQETRTCSVPRTCTQPTVAPTESCRNAGDDSFCNLWKAYCSRSKEFQRNCAKTCGKCQVAPTESCRNAGDDSFCNLWKAYCSRSKDFQRNCAKTCGKC